MEIPHPTTNKSNCPQMQQNTKNSIKMIEREVNKGLVYTVAPSIGASVPGATSTLLAPLGSARGVSANEICTAESTMASSISVRPL